MNNISIVPERAPQTIIKQCSTNFQKYLLAGSVLCRFCATVLKVANCHWLWLLATEHDHDFIKFMESVWTILYDIVFYGQAVEHYGLDQVYLMFGMKGNTYAARQTCSIQRKIPSIRSSCSQYTWHQKALWHVLTFQEGSMKWTAAVLCREDIQESMALSKTAFLVNRTLDFDQYACFPVVQLGYLVELHNSSSEGLLVSAFDGFNQSHDEFGFPSGGEARVLWAVFLHIAFRRHGVLEIGHECANNSRMVNTYTKCKCT